MRDKVIRLRRQRSQTVLFVRWSVLVRIATVVVVPVYVRGGAWVLVTTIAVFSLMASALVIGVEFFAADTIEFNEDCVRF